MLDFVVVMLLLHGCRRATGSELLSIYQNFNPSALCVVVVVVAFACVHDEFR